MRRRFPLSDDPLDECNVALLGPMDDMVLAMVKMSFWTWWMIRLWYPLVYQTIRLKWSGCSFGSVGWWGRSFGSDMPRNSLLFRISWTICLGLKAAAYYHGNRTGFVVQKPRQSSTVRWTERMFTNITSIRRSTFQVYTQVKIDRLFTRITFWNYASPFSNYTSSPSN